MDASAVAEYLKQHPEFFENYADAVAEIFVPHPHGGHAIPIAERQIVALRERTRELERRLGEMIRHGADNDVIGDKLHRSTLALFAARDVETTLAVLAHSLREDFCGAAGRDSPVVRGARQGVATRIRRGLAGRCANMPTGCASRTAVPRPSRKHAAGSRRARRRPRLRFCRFVPRRPSACSR